jgi:hypothetical protein
MTMFRRSAGLAAVSTLAIVFLGAPAGAEEIDDNLRFELTRGSATYEKPMVELKPGDWLLATTKRFAGAEALAPHAGKPVTFVFEFESQGKSLATHRFNRDFHVTDKFFKFNLIPDPSTNDDKALRWDWSGGLARALSQLPQGKHPVTIRGHVDAGGARTMVVRGAMVYDNSDGNGDMAKIADAIDKNASVDMQAINAAHQPKHVEFPVTFTIRNACGQAVTVKYRVPGNREASINLGGLQSKKVTALAMDSLIVIKGGKASSGPMPSRSSEGKTLTVCK